MPEILNGVPEWLLAIGAIGLCILALSAVFGVVLERVLRLISLESLVRGEAEQPAPGADERRRTP